MEVVAHRTLPRDAAENSLQGLWVAGQKDCAGVEIDLRLTLDGKPYLMHDFLMLRTVGIPWPIALTPSFLVRKLSLKANGTAVPPLHLALENIPEGRYLAVDIKSAAAVRPLVEQVRARGLESRVRIWCTSARSIAWVRREAPSIECTYLKTCFSSFAKRGFIRQALKLGVPAISAHWFAIDARFVKAAHAVGLRVYAFHGDRPLNNAKLLSGLDGLITDYPDEARATLAQLLPDHQAEAIAARHHARLEERRRLQERAVSAGGDYFFASD